jgi:hypothetical protein
MSRTSLIIALKQGMVINSITQTRLKKVATSNRNAFSRETLDGSKEEAVKSEMAFRASELTGERERQE